MASSVTAKIFLYADQITKLLKAFQERFDLLHKFENVFKIFICPFNLEIEEALEILQFKLIDLQASTELKYVFGRINRLRFYGKYVDVKKCPNLKQMPMRIAAVMGTTYICECFFS